MANARNSTGIHRSARSPQDPNTRDSRESMRASQEIREAKELKDSKDEPNWVEPAKRAARPPISISSAPQAALAAANSSNTPLPVAGNSFIYSSKILTSISCINLLFRWWSSFCIVFNSNFALSA